ncbi:MAG: hypothetical protein KGM16_19650 [Bacteroidota bacterium]|nr:hypothetical protein [Bacteroidota bacterium]
MDRSLHKWLSVSLFNLLLVSVLGSLLRYKIAYSLPIVNQKFLLHAHSHFAFSGWVTQALMALMIKYLADKTNSDQFVKYRWILWANLISSYGMLFTFPFMGYALPSIFFSSVSLFTGYAFAVKYWRDLNKMNSKPLANLFFKAGLFFNVLSSVGVFTLAFLMATKNMNQDYQLASLYFFLHFQYNGWFLFACMGLLAYWAEGLLLSVKQLKTVFYLFAGACIPAYLLSALWIPMPEWIYVIVILAVLSQLLGWMIIVRSLLKNGPLLKTKTSSTVYTLFFLCAIAFTLKLLLQAASAIPSLSFLTYGFRPIVIGYLHLVLLGVISLFIITYCMSTRKLVFNKINITGVKIFVAGIILNEVFLLAQGIADLVYDVVPYINEALLFAATVLFAGLLLMNLSGNRKVTLATGNEL